MQLIKPTAVSLLIGLMFSSQASAVLINDGGVFDGTNVGLTDTLLDTTTDLSVGGLSGCHPTQSSPTNETCWANYSQSTTYTFEGKTETVQAYTTDGANVIAFQLAFGPGTYIVKNSTDWGLFTNLIDINWGVIDTSLLGGFNLSDTQLTISHVTEFDGGGGPPQQQIPEPTSLLLLAIGLLGLGGLRRIKTH